jgi:hypothetical protein
MGDLASPADETTVSFCKKTTTSQFVAYTRFRGVVNVPAHIWVVRDWARRCGLDLVGPPACVFLVNGGGPSEALCEVQWALPEIAGSTGDEIGLRWLEPQDVVAAYYREDAASLRGTFERLYAWGAGKGYSMTGERRDIYHSYVKRPTENRLTEIQLYIEDPCRSAGILSASGPSR